MLSIKPLWLTLLLAPFLSFSANVLAVPGHWMPTAKNIASIIVEGDDQGQALILIEGGVPSDFIPAACSAGFNGSLNTLMLGTEKGRAMYAMALTAYTSGKKVKLALDCLGSRPLVTHIWLI
jgi:hypothetical protein